MRFLKFLFFAFLTLWVFSCAQNTETIQEFSNKNSKYYYNIGMASLTAGNYAKAIAEFKRAILKYPNNYKAYESLAMAYANVGDYKKAIKSIDKALEIKPDYYQAILGKATILQASGDIEGAIKTLNLCIQNDLCTLRPEAYYQLANIYKKRNDMKDYIKYLNMAILYDRNFKVAKMDLANAYIKLNMCKNKDIAKKVSALLSNQLDNNQATILKAKCYIQAKAFDKANKLIDYIINNANISDYYKNQAINLSKYLVQEKYNINQPLSTTNLISFAPEKPPKKTNTSQNKSPENNANPKSNKNITQNKSLESNTNLKTSKNIPQNKNQENNISPPSKTNTIKKPNVKEEASNKNSKKSTSLNSGKYAYYQIGLYNIKEYAEDMYLKAQKYGFKSHILENGKSLIVYAKVPQEKLKEFKKLFPFAFEIKNTDEFKNYKEVSLKDLNKPFYYQLGLYNIKEYAEDMYLKAQKYGFKSHILENGKSLIVYAEVPQEKLKEFKKLFPFAFEIKNTDELKAFKLVK